MKYLIRIDYNCEIAREINNNGGGFIVESITPPKIGVINSRPFKSGPLLSHGCKRYYDSQTCDDDISCNWQNIFEIKDYTKDEADRLNAQELSKLEIIAANH